MRAWKKYAASAKREFAFISSSRLAPRKALGQHFLRNRRLLAYIVREARVEGKQVVEIGAGEGTLTRFLAERAAFVTAIEKDIRFASLHEQLRLENVRFIYADCRKVDFAALLRDAPGPVVGNLPFNLTAPIFFALLPLSPLFESLCFLLQREVAERIAAPPGPSFGLLSALVQYYCKVEPLKVVKRESFYPPPRVDAQLLRLYSRGKPWDPDFLSFLKRGFAHRRKKLRAFFLREGLTKEAGSELGDCRAQDLSAETWRRLYQVKEESTIEG